MVDVPYYRLETLVRMLFVSRHFAGRPSQVPWSHVSLFAVLDIPMMQLSDRAYLVVDRRRNRSLQSFLLQDNARGSRNGWLYQLVDLDPEISQVFCHDGIAVGSLDGLLQELTSGSFFAVQDLSKTHSASILASQTRRADLQGMELQRVHEDLGKYLADKLLDDYGHRGDLLCCDAEFPHVQGGSFRGEKAAGSNVVILAMMRGGEPLARGVYQRFPSAQFVHYNDDDDKVEVQEGNNDKLCQVLLDSSSMSMSTRVIIIVDSVINSGASIRRVIGKVAPIWICPNQKATTVYVVTAVMQKEAAHQLPREFPRVGFLALRVSQNQYVGSGGTDTGNRLFGTMAVE
jgi:uracil phosphoribosyltransferase